MTEGQIHKIRYLHTEKYSVVVKKKTDTLYDKRRWQDKFSENEKLQNMVYSMLSQTKD